MLINHLLKKKEVGECWEGVMRVWDGVMRVWEGVMKVLEGVGWCERVL